MKRTCLTPILVCLLLAAGARLSGGADSTTVKGRIVGEDGTPLAGIAVSAAGTDCTTGKDGLFSIPVSAPQVQVRFHNAFLDEAGLPKSLRPENDTRILFLPENQGKDLGDVRYLKYGCLVKGTVRDGGGKAVDGARVYLAKSDGWFIGAATTGADGAYSMKVPLSNSSVPVYSLRVYRGDGPSPDVLEIGSLKTWESNVADVTCAKTRSSLEGAVTLDGAPLPAAEILLFRKDQKSGVTFYPVVRSGDGGKFAFADVPEGSYVIHVLHPKAFRAAFPAVCPDGPHGLDVRSGPAGAVEGTFQLTVDGRAFLDTVAEQDQKDQVGTGLFLCGADGKLLVPQLPVALVELRDGGWAFRVENVPEGEYRFRLLSFQKAGSPSGLKTAKGDQLAVFGQPFLHEGRRLIPEMLSPEKLGIVMKAVVRKGETARIEVKKDFTTKEIQALMESGK